MIHGDRSQSQRTAALAGFQRGHFRVLVATDLASRGIHVQDIAHVINYDLPEMRKPSSSRRTYGRAGERGVASTLFHSEQRPELLQLERAFGVQMERMREAAVNPNIRVEWMDGRRLHRELVRERSSLQSALVAPNRRPDQLGPLPGEVLQVQMEN